MKIRRKTIRKVKLFKFSKIIAWVLWYILSKSLLSTNCMPCWFKKYFIKVCSVTLYYNITINSTVKQKSIFAASYILHNIYSLGYSGDRNLRSSVFSNRFFIEIVLITVLFLLSLNSYSWTTHLLSWVLPSSRWLLRWYLVLLLFSAVRIQKHFVAINFLLKSFTYQEQQWGQHPYL